LSRTVMHLDIIKIDAESRFAGKRSQGRLDMYLRWLPIFINPMPIAWTTKWKGGKNG